MTNYKRWIFPLVIEEQMFSTADGGAKLFLKASELVYVPFKFQSFTSENVALAMVCPI